MIKPFGNLVVVSDLPGDEHPVPQQATVLFAIIGEEPEEVTLRRGAISAYGDEVDDLLVGEVVFYVGSHSVALREGYRIVRRDCILARDEEE